MKKLTLYLCAVLTASFLIYVLIDIGPLSSISKSAKFLMASGQEWMFFVFVWSLGFTVDYVGNSMLAAFAGSL